MSDDALFTHLAELEKLIHSARADGEIDEAERDKIAALVERVRDDITAAAEDDGIGAQLEESAVRFEGRHPRIVDAIRAAVDTLSGYGV